MTKKVLIIGGSGFIGKNVVNFLLKKNYKVTVYDKIKTSFDLKTVKFIKGSILDKKKLTKHIKENEIIYHFAAISDIKEANKNTIATIKQNIIGTVNILDEVKKNKKKKLIFASSIYARSAQGGIYSISKRASESLIDEYARKFKFKFVILRFGSIYGPEANKFNPINQIIKSAVKNKKIIRPGNGEEVRSYIHVKDASKLCFKVLEKKYLNKYFNLIGEKKIKVKKLLNLVSKKTSSKIIYNPKIKMDYHYSINPFTFKVKKGLTLIEKKPIKLSLGITEIINSFNK